MISPKAVRFLSVLLLTFWVGTALADKRVALIVGNSQYTRISPKLVNPANDAPDIAQALESIGFKVILKTDVGKGEFDRSLAEFAREAAGAETALFYYAGHGLQHQRQNFFLPVDIEVKDSADVEFQAVGMDRILAATNRSTGVRIVILDACRDNPLAKEFAARGMGGGVSRGLARIDKTEGLIIAYATAPDQVAQDGVGRNSPFTESLIKRIKQPGLEIGTMFRRVANDVNKLTKGHQRPEYSDSLLSDYFLNPTESDTIAWGRIRDSNETADFQDFIQKFPTSSHARDAQTLVDRFERIRREREEAAKIERERIALEAEKKRHEEAQKEAERIALETERKRQDEAAKKEAERIALETERKRQDEAAKKEAERIALETEKKRHQEEARKEAERIAQQKNEAARSVAEKADAQRREAERLQSEKRAGEERAKVAAIEEESKKHDIEREKQRTSEICDRDLARLKDLTATLQTPAIQNLARETACPTIKPAIETALREAARGVEHACDADRKTLASLKDSDIGSLKTAVARMNCETVRAEAQVRVAKLEVEMQRKQSVCAAEKTNLDAIDASTSGARQQYVEFLAHAACLSLHAEVSGIIKKIDSRVKEAQTELARLGCYNAPINGKFDDATKKSLTLYNTKKGSLADGDHLTDGLLSELKQQALGVCPSEPPVVATPGNGAPPVGPVPPKQKIEHATQSPPPRHNRQAVSRPPRHITQSAAREKVSAPRSHQKAHPKSVVAGRAPRMPPSPAAAAGSGNNAAVHGVGF